MIEYERIVERSRKQEDRDLGCLDERILGEGLRRDRNDFIRSIGSNDKKMVACYPLPFSHVR